MRSRSIAVVDPAPRVPQDDAAQACVAAFTASLQGAARAERPYRHWRLRDALPQPLQAAIDALPFAPLVLGGISGTREAHNGARRYFDPPTIAAFPACRAVAEAFQDRTTVAAIAAVTGADLDGCRLRVEFALDGEGFWLQPHTDLGVKRFTLLCYLSPKGRPDLGTDLYADPGVWSHRARFDPGAALAFVPAADTWHGFEPRPIRGIRKSLIVNYVTEQWRSREQLAFPDDPVRV